MVALNSELKRGYIGTNERIPVMVSYDVEPTKVDYDYHLVSSQKLNPAELLEGILEVVGAKLGDRKREFELGKRSPQDNDDEVDSDNNDRDDNDPDDNDPDDNDPDDNDSDDNDPDNNDPDDNDVDSEDVSLRQGQQGQQRQQGQQQRQLSIAAVEASVTVTSVPPTTAVVTSAISTASSGVVVSSGASSATSSAVASKASSSAAGNVAGNPGADPAGNAGKSSGVPPGGVEGQGYSESNSTESTPGNAQVNAAGPVDTTATPVQVQAGGTNPLTVPKLLTTLVSLLAISLIY